MPLEGIISAQRGEIMASHYPIKILPANIDPDGRNLHPAKLLIAAHREDKNNGWYYPKRGEVRVDAGEESESALIFFGVRWDNEHVLVHDIVQGLERFPSLLPPPLANKDDLEAALGVPFQQINGSVQKLYDACAIHPWKIHLFHR